MRIFLQQTSLLISQGVGLDFISFDKNTSKNSKVLLLFILFTNYRSIFMPTTLHVGTSSQYRFSQRMVRVKHACRNGNNSIIVNFWIINNIYIFHQNLRKFTWSLKDGPIGIHIQRPVFFREILSFKVIKTFFFPYVAPQTSSAFAINNLFLQYSWPFL